MNEDPHRSPLLLVIAHSMKFQLPCLPQQPLRTRLWSHTVEETATETGTERRRGEANPNCETPLQSGFHGLGFATTPTIF